MSYYLKVSEVQSLQQNLDFICNALANDWHISDSDLSELGESVGKVCKLYHETVLKVAHDKGF